MGLAIAKAIVEAHGGTIGVTSQLGHGSSVLLHAAASLSQLRAEQAIHQHRQDSARDTDVRANPAPVQRPR